MERASLLKGGLRPDAVGYDENCDEQGRLSSARPTNKTESALRRALWSGFLRSAQQFPQRLALVAEAKVLTYEQLRELACRIAATIQRYPEFSSTPLTVVFAYRSPTAFAGILGALLAGNGYVPLNRTFPEGRTQLMFQRSDSRSLVVDAKSLLQLNGLLEGAQER